MPKVVEKDNCVDAPSPPREDAIVEILSFYDDDDDAEEESLPAGYINERIFTPSGDRFTAVELFDAIHHIFDPWQARRLTRAEAMQRSWKSTAPIFY